MAYLRDFLITLRVTQWTKNLVVFAGLIFSLHIFQFDFLLPAFVGFVLFCLCTGSVYVFNDIVDRHHDAQHPQKKFRPIASGTLSLRVAGISAALLFLTGLMGSFALDMRFALTLAGYGALQVLYSFWLKKIVILDVMVIASGFVLRAAAGAFLIDVEISHWLLTTTFLLALFLGLGKRRHELVLMSDRATTHRSVLAEYSAYFLDQLIMIVTSSIIIVYLLYTSSPEVTERFGGPTLLFTMPFVLYGVFRYLYLIHKKEDGGNPSKTLLTDRPLLLDVVFWAIIVLSAAYFAPANQP